MKRAFKIIFSVLFGDRFFKLQGRADLVEFWLVFVVYWMLPWGWFLRTEPGSTVSVCLMLFIVFLQPWIMWGLVVRRLHDLNLRGWWMLTILPLLVLPFWPGKKEPNRFNEDD